ncbi:flippase [Mariniflexile sp. HMF6888]|uniref:flippase n=1 Tax=Mariniflexile sp. HMF6888 TaxID=3373086 RepID=UPI0037AE218C
MGNTKRNFIYNTLLGLTNILVPIITFPYASRVLGPEGIGITSFALSLSITFIVLGSLGIPIYGIREVAKSKKNIKDLSKTFSELLIIHLLWTILIMIFYAVWIIISKTYQNEDAIKYFSFIHILSSVGLINWFYQGMEKYRFISVINFISKILTIFLLFILVKKPEDYWLYYLIIVLSNVLSVLISILYSLNIVKLTLLGLDFKKHFKPIIILFSTQMAITIYVNLDVIMLKYFSDLKDVGYYSASIKIIKILLVLITSLGMVLIPKIAIYIKEKKINEVKNLIERSINFVLLMSIPIIFYLFITSKDIILLFAGQDFLLASLLLKLLTPLILIVGLANIFSLQILVPSNNEKTYMFIVLLGLVINIILNSVLIPIMHSKGAVLATLTTEFTGLVLTYHYSKKVIDFYFPIKKVIKYLLISLLFVPISLFFSSFIQESLVYLIVLAICSGIIYFSFLFLIKDKFFIEFVFRPVYNKIILKKQL